MRALTKMLMAFAVTACLLIPGIGFSGEQEIPVFLHMPRDAKVIGTISARGRTESGALEALQNKAADRGANGLVNVEYSRSYPSSGKPADLFRNSWAEATGTAIRVK